MVPVFKIPSEVREGEIRLSTAHPPSGEAYTLAVVHRTLFPLQLSYISSIELISNPPNTHPNKLSYKPSYMFLHLTSVETANKLFEIPTYSNATLYKGEAPKSNFLLVNMIEQLIILL